MRVGELLKTLGVWLLGISGTGALIGAIAAWVGKLVADRLSAATNARYARELEQLKSQYSGDLEQLRSELASHRDMLSGTHGALASGYAGAYERVVTAIEFLWYNMMETRRFVDPYIFFYQILLPSEYEGASADVVKIQGMIPRRSEIEFHEETLRLREGIEEKRPFLGERLWLLQFVYFAFAMRLALKVRQERGKGQFFSWNTKPDGTPDTMQKFLEYAFSKKELDTLIGTGVETGTAADLGIPHRILAAMESKILSEMNEWIFGKRLVTMSVEEQQRVARLMTRQDADLHGAAQSELTPSRAQGDATT